MKIILFKSILRSLDKTVEGVCNDIIDRETVHMAQGKGEFPLRTVLWLFLWLIVSTYFYALKRWVVNEYAYHCESTAHARWERRLYGSTTADMYNQDLSLWKKDRQFPAWLDWWQLPSFVLDLLYTLRTRGACACFGHEYTCESSIGPESGSEYFQCTRCGHSHTVTYY